MELGYLDEAKHHKHEGCSKQKWAKEAEILASLDCPECVYGEAHNHRSRQNHS